MLDDEGAAVVEDHDPGGFVEHEHVGPAECVADVEDAATGLDRTRNGQMAVLSRRRVGLANVTKSRRRHEVTAKGKDTDGFFISIKKYFSHMFTRQEGNL